MPCRTSSSREAESLYREYRRWGAGGWGPFIHQDDELRGKYFDSQIDKFLAHEALLFGHDDTLWMPSAWHAMLFFLRIERALKHGSSPKHQLYRGQPNAHWRIQSSFDRLTDENRNREWLGTVVFSYYLARRLYCPYLRLDSYVGAARHYGFASSFTDWSVDPAVAIWFACQDDGSGDPRPEARVFMLQVPDSVQYGMEVCCPLPFCQRLYSQLGVFLQTPIARRLDLTDRCRSVVFPKPKDEPFVVWRDGVQVDLLTTHEWLDKSAEWIRDAAASDPRAIESNAAITALVS